MDVDLPKEDEIVDLDEIVVPLPVIVDLIDRDVEQVSEVSWSCVVPEPVVVDS